MAGETNLYCAMTMKYDTDIKHDDTDNLTKNYSHQPFFSQNTKFFTFFYFFIPPTEKRPKFDILKVRNECKMLLKFHTF